MAGTHRRTLSAWRLGVPRPTRGDLFAGVTVAAVVVPQSLAYAQLAGMPPERGLLAAVLPPIVAALLASSPYLQTGPVAITSLLTFGVLSTHATPGSERYVQLGIALAFVVGVARIALGLARGGVVAYLLSEPAMLGFVQGAALLICLSQVPTLVGVGAGGDGIVVEAARALEEPGSWSRSSIAIGVAALAAIVALRRLGPLVPGVLIVTVLGLLAGMVVDDIATVGPIDVALPAFDLEEMSSGPLTLYLSGLVIALVGFAEPAAIARTLATRERQRWDADQELVSQGAANVAAAVSGAFPVGGSFSRSSLNRAAGATTRLSGAVTGLAVLVALPFVGVLSDLPQAVLAAIVVLAAASLLRPLSLLRIVRFSLPQAVVCWGTLIATLAFSPDIAWAVLVGIGLALAVHLGREMSIDIDTIVNGDRLVFRPRGVMWFVSSSVVEDAFAAALAANPGVRRAEISLRGIGRMDLTGALALRRMLHDARSASLDVRIIDMPPRARRWTRSLIQSSDDPL